MQPVGRSLVGEVGILCPDPYGDPAIFPDFTDKPDFSQLPVGEIDKLVEKNRDRCHVELDKTDKSLDKRKLLNGG